MLWRKNQSPVVSNDRVRKVCKRFLCAGGFFMHFREAFGWRTIDKYMENKENAIRSFSTQGHRCMNPPTYLMLLLCNRTLGCNEVHCPITDPILSTPYSKIVPSVYSWFCLTFFIPLINLDPVSHFSINSVIYVCVLRFCYAIFEGLGHSDRNEFLSKLFQNSGRQINLKKHKTTISEENTIRGLKTRLI